MLKWALIFFVVSLVAGFLGFSGVSAATATIARVLFGIALVIFLIFPRPRAVGWRCRALARCRGVERRKEATRVLEAFQGHGSQTLEGKTACCCFGGSTRIEADRSLQKALRPKKHAQQD